MSFAAEMVTLPGPGLNQLGRLVGVLEAAEPRVRRRFLRLVRDTQALMQLEQIATLLETGQVIEALAISEDIAPGLAATLEQVYAAAGLSAAEVIRSQSDTLFEFNAANRRAVSHLQETRLRLLVEFTGEQRAATQVFLQSAFERGLSPIEQARELQKSIGLTRHQSRIIQNYRRNLEQRSTAALTRTLRDRRFDSTVARAIRTDTPLSAAQIDRMVDRYSERWVRFRANTIAKTESLAAAGAADLEAWTQAVDAGVIDEEDITQVWRTSLRDNRRDSHRAMEGQKRKLREPFTSGAGVALRFPGDPRAGAAETANCNCVVARATKQDAISQRSPRAATPGTLTPAAEVVAA
jgi:hypothetical protein